MVRASFLFVSFLLLVLPASRADHPNEGKVLLADLIKEARQNSPLLKELRLRQRQRQFEAEKDRALFFPEFSLEGGPQTTKFDREKDSGTTYYGRLDWNLFRGGRDQALLNKSESEKTLAEKRLAQVETKLIRDVMSAYYELLFVLESAALKEKALEMNREQMKLARSKKSSGFTSQSDVIEFELREATLRADLKDLEQRRDEDSRSLAVLLGRNQSDSLILVKGHLLNENFDTDMKAPASEENIEILEARSDYQISLQEIQLAKADFLPRLDLEGRYGKIANEERVFEDADNYFAGLKLKIPLFSGFSGVQELQAAKAQSLAKESELGRKRIEVQTATQNLRSRLLSIKTRLDLEEKTLSKSEEYYKITLGEYRRGVKNSPDMVVAAERLLEARIRNLQYRRDYHLAHLEYLGLTGEPAEKIISTHLR